MEAISKEHPGLFSPKISFVQSNQLFRRTRKMTWSFWIAMRSVFLTLIIPIFVLYFTLSFLLPLGLPRILYGHCIYFLRINSLGLPPVTSVCLPYGHCIYFLFSLRGILFIFFLPCGAFYLLQDMQTFCPSGLTLRFYFLYIWYLCLFLYLNVIYLSHIMIIT